MGIPQPGQEEQEQQIDKLGEGEHMLGQIPLAVGDDGHEELVGHGAQEGEHQNGRLEPALFVPSAALQQPPEADICIEYAHTEIRFG